MKKIFSGVALLVIAGVLFLSVFIGCSVLSTETPELSTNSRLSTFPTSGAQLEHPVTIRWNQHAVPFIESRSDTDGFFALGAVHAHLRLGQMELLKRLAAGRLSEIAGPITEDIDHTLRIVGIGRAADALVINLDEETRTLLTAFVAGINWYVEETEQLPPEFELFQLEKEKWTMEDVVLLSRLGGVDLSWIFYLGFLRIEDAPMREEMWKLFLENRKGSSPSFSVGSPGSGDAVDRFSHLLAGNSRSGSNSVVVSGNKTEHGAALIASDPHLGISIPNFWVLAGLKSETFHVVGMMIPGLPFFALGRNPDIAWGGTNMRAISSHLYRLEEKELAQVKSYKETIKSRWWFDSEVEVRLSPFGPLLSDSPFLSHVKEPIALSWAGHRSDTTEVKTFFAANRATDFEEFREAFEGYAVSAQNFLFADRAGNIGHLLAYQQPVLRNPEATLHLTKSPENPVLAFRKSNELPFAFNPTSGFIASANNKPIGLDIPLALSYANDDRFERLSSIISSLKTVTVQDLKLLQQDVFSESSHALRKRLLRLVSPAEVEGFDFQEKAVHRAFATWDGHFHPGSRGALAYHLVLSLFVPPLFEDVYTDPTLRRMLLRGSYWLSALKTLLDDPSKEAILKGALLFAFQEAASPFFRYNSWGDVHRQSIQHPLGRVPVLGYRFRFAEYGAAGGNDTLLKSGHGFSTENHNVTYGAQARHISDLSDMDANYFVLLGGQDGWLRNENLIDQVPLWREGRYIQLPLSRSAVRQHFPLVLSLKPDSSSSGGNRSRLKK